MLVRKTRGNSKFQNGDQPNRRLDLVVTKQCYTKLKTYSEVSGYTMTSILETAIDEFFSKSEWEEIISNYILAKVDNDE